MEQRLIGKIVSRRFRVEDVIGRGGMAIVYRAFDLKTHQTVALKVLREEYENDAEYVERFRREAEVCRKLSHPNVVNMIGHGTAGGISYIAMEYVDGKTLKEMIQEQGSVEQGQAVRIALQILAALSHAHLRGIIHRDVKSQNVLLSHTGQVKIGDFGIAGMADTKTLTSDGNVMGSVHYFSPEQAKGMKATEASDLYSVGVILYEMLTGHVPFEGETAVSVAMMHLMEPPKPIEQQADVCRAVELIVKKALEKKPVDRYQNAEAMMRDLRRGLRHPDGGFMDVKKREVRTDPAIEEVRSRKRRRSMLSRAVSVAIALVLVAAPKLIPWLRRMPYLAGLDSTTALRMVSSAGLSAKIDYAYSDMPEGYVAAQSPGAYSQVRREESVLVVISRGSGHTPVQKLAGLTQDEAQAALTAQGLTLGSVEIVPSMLMRGTVVSQKPEAGESVPLGGQVDLTISGGRVVVPELVGQREEEALERIHTVGLSCGMIEYETVQDARQDGVVLSQSLEKFAEVLPGTTVEMSVGFYDKRRFSAEVTVNVTVPEEGVSLRVTLVGEDGKESDMYAVTLNEPGDQKISVLLRSETSGVMTWRTYLDGGFAGEATAVLK